LFVQFGLVDSTHTQLNVVDTQLQMNRVASNNLLWKAAVAPYMGVSVNYTAPIRATLCAVAESQLGRGALPVWQAVSSGDELGRWLELLLATPADADFRARALYTLLTWRWPNTALVYPNFELDCLMVDCDYA
jgi:hypothetical protein